MEEMQKGFQEIYEESDEYCPHCDNHYVGNHFLSFFLI